MNNILQRISQISDLEGISIGKIEQMIGASKGVLYKAIQKNTDIQSKWLAGIVENFPQYNSEWLLTGQGDKLKDKTNVLSETSENYNREPKAKTTNEIPLIPIEAMAGYSNGDVQVMQYDIISGYKIPELEGKGVKYLIRVSGSSMYPKYSNGDLLACKPLQDRAFFQWGKPYVLDTDQGSIVKRLFPCNDDEDCLECRSDNSVHYPPFKIPKDSIRAFAIVVGVIRLE